MNDLGQKSENYGPEANSGSLFVFAKFHWNTAYICISTVALAL